MAHRLDRWRWWIELDAEATLALVQGYASDSAYALLHETGSLMHDEHGPITEDNWANACATARENSAVYILSIHDKRVIRVAYGKTGVYVNCKYVFFVLDDEALQSITNDDAHLEIQREEAKTTGPKRKQLSGAEKRRRKRASRV